MGLDFIDRKLSLKIKEDLQYFSTLTLTGPRQAGKTTLCKAIFPDFHYVNAEDMDMRLLIEESPKEFLKKFPQGVIIDEAQRVPSVFSAAQVLVDEDRSRKIIFTGSCNFSLIKGITQSLAGRTSILTLPALSLEELGATRISLNKEELIFRGGYPAVWKDITPIPPQNVYRAYNNSYLERDLRELISIKDLGTYQQFLRICAGLVGNEFNASKISGELGISNTTARNWLSVLEASYIVFRLPPFFKNIRKRIVKSPKIYFYDTGLASNLLGIKNSSELVGHPLAGALFENLVVAEFVKRRLSRGDTLSDLFFYRDNSGHEIDLIEESAGKIYASEIKSANSLHKDFFKNLKYLQNLLGSDLASTRVIYDGTAELNTPENGVVNFRNL